MGRMPTREEAEVLLFAAGGRGSLRREAVRSCWDAGWLTEDMELTDLGLTALQCYMVDRVLERAGADD
jgi:hypothetical protein